jgi:hypothetical protein
MEPPGSILFFIKIDTSINTYLTGNHPFCITAALTKKSASFSANHPNAMVYGTSVILNNRNHSCLIFFLVLLNLVN